MFAALRRAACSVFRRERSEPSDRPRVDAREGEPLRRPRRPLAEVEADLQSLRDKLRSIEEALAREHEFSHKAGSRSNQGVVEALKRRSDRVRDRMNRLAGDLTSGGTGLISSPKTRAVRWHEARGNDATLAQAANRALKRGKFDNASERAIFEKIVSDLRDGGRDIQLHVLERLGELESTPAIPVFAAAALHHSENVRLAALRGVLTMRHPATRDILVGALLDSSHRVRVWAVRGLYGLSDRSLDEVLSQQLRDPHPAVRRACATYLSWKRIPGAERHLLRCLRDESAEVRAAVANALGQCGSDRAVFKLIVALKDSEAPVREAAAAALAKLAGNTPEIDVNAGDDERREQIDQLREWWKTARVERCTSVEEPGDLGDEFDADDDAAMPSLDDEASVATEEAPDEAAVGDLDAVPDMGFDSVDDGFVSTDGEESAG